MLIAYDRIIMTLATFVLFSWNFQRSEHILHVNITRASHRLAHFVFLSLFHQHSHLETFLSTISQYCFFFGFCFCFFVVEMKVRWMRIKVSARTDIVVCAILRNAWNVVLVRMANICPYDCILWSHFISFTLWDDLPYAWYVFDSILKALSAEASCCYLTEFIWSGRMSLFMAAFPFPLIYFFCRSNIFWSATPNEIQIPRWRSLYGFMLLLVVLLLFTLSLYPFARAVCT